MTCSTCKNSQSHTDLVESTGLSTWCRLFFVFTTHCVGRQTGTVAGAGAADEEEDEGAGGAGGDGSTVSKMKCSMTESGLFLPLAGGGGGPTWMSRSSGAILKYFSTTLLSHLPMRRMASAGQPKWTKPWAPVALRVCPETRSDPSGKSAMSSFLAASRMTFTMWVLSTTRPSCVGKSGRSGSGRPPSECLFGKVRLSQRSWSRTAWYGQPGEEPPGGHIHLCVRLHPSAL